MTSKFLFLSLISIFLLLSCNDAKLNSTSKEKVAKSVMEIDSLRISQFIGDAKEQFLISKDMNPKNPFKDKNEIYHKKILLKSEALKNTLAIHFMEYQTEEAFKEELELFLKSIGDLETVVWGKDAKFVKSQPIFAVFNARSMIFMKYQCENSLDKRRIENIQANLLKWFSIKNGVSMDIKCGGPLKWN